MRSPACRSATGDDPPRIRSGSGGKDRVHKWVALLHRIGGRDVAPFRDERGTFDMKSMLGDATLTANCTKAVMAGLLAMKMPESAS